MTDRRRRPGLAWALCVAAAALPWPSASAPARDVRLALEARLFQRVSGSLSKDVLAPDAPALWNVVAAEDPSTATLVLVVVALAPGGLLRSDARVRLTVRGTNGAPVLDRSLEVGPVARGGKTHVAFWLDGTGCRPLRLQARLTMPDGSSGPPPVAADLPFACGE